MEEPNGINYLSVEINDGIIVNIGNFTTKEEFSNENVKIIDLNGKTILPGFIDSHAHWIGDRDLYGFQSYL